jgi:MoaA/NifB/PqqE/SkfB family radical SAM enzyme
VMGEKDRTAAFQDAYHFCPPSFLVIAPTKRCNLLCTGCYAASSAKDAETLSFDVFDRIIREKRELWGSFFTVITGGEPLLYRDGDKTLFDILENNADTYFMMYTNGVLITKDVAKRMANCGNLTPSVSVEGFEKETDTRRGKGTYRKIMTAMENLRDAGVPFGVSITATRNNVDIVMSDEFVDHYINGQGAAYAWVFQYMPIGRRITTDLMITPEQRLALFKREQKLIEETEVFLVDFWNGGPYAVGCFSAGRAGGYFYIDWNGNIAPCAFMPYYVANINELYRENKTLNDVLFSPYFTAIRNWQNEYAYRQPADKLNNLITPCFMRDHFDTAYQTIRDFQAKGLDENASEAINDSEYRRTMSDYGRNVRATTQGAWEEFIGRPGAGNMGRPSAPARA